MHRLNILILQARPSHQILLHQACNAHGVFRVRLASSLGAAKASLAEHGPVDAVIVDHAMAPLDGKVLFKHLRKHDQARALLFVGEPAPGVADLTHEARRQQLWVLGQVPWSLPAPSIQLALQQLCRRASRFPPASIQTVTLPAHAY